MEPCDDLDSSLVLSISEMPQILIKFLLYLLNKWTRRSRDETSGSEVCLHQDTNKDTDNHNECKNSWKLGAIKVCTARDVNKKILRRSTSSGISWRLWGNVLNKWSIISSVKKKKKKMYEKMVVSSSSIIWSRYNVGHEEWLSCLQARLDG